MPSAATLGGTGQGTQKNGRAQQAPIPMVPFIRASAEHREPTGIDVQRQLLITGTQNLGVFDIPAYGYVRNIVLVVTASGAAGAPTFHEDFPFSSVVDVALTEPNGAVIAQFGNLWECMIANKWGGYRAALGADPRQAPSFSTDATGNFSYIVRIPVELNLRDGLGSLPNQNAAAVFKLRMTLASGAVNGGLYGATVPTTQPTVRVQAYLEAWDQPEANVAGQSNQITPPAMNTTQFWSSQPVNVSAGYQTIRLTRVGNYIRNLILVYRRAAGTRALGDADFPDPISFFLDTRPLDQVSKLLWKHTMFERSGFGGRAPGGAAAPTVDTAGALDAGVFVYDFTHEFDGCLGLENRDLWLPTLGSTRLEFQGTFANAGVLTVLTNDVAIAGSVFI